MTKKKKTPPPPPPPPTPGVYRLARDVKNPRPDRRSTDWHNLPTIPKGTRFLVESYDDDEDLKLGRVTLRRVNRDMDTMGGVMPHSELYAPLVVALEPVPESTGKVLIEAKREYIDADEILAMLVSQHKLSYRDLREAAVAVKALSDGPEEGGKMPPAWRAFQAEHGLVGVSE